MISGASNSLMTRARAKYGARLRKSDYETLAGCRHLKEAVSYLAANKCYGEFLSPLAGSSHLSRNRFEEALSAAFMNTASSLCSFEKSVGEYVMRYIMLSNETELILDFIVKLTVGNPQEMILRIPPKFSTGTKLDFNKLFALREPAEISRYFSKTAYSALTSVLPKNREEGYDISLIEATLDRIKSEMVIAQAGKAFSAETAKVLADEVRMRCELQDFRMIYRAKKYYGLSNGYIRTNMIGLRSRLSSKMAEQMLDAADAEETLRIFSKSGYAHQVEKYGTDDIDLFCKKAEVAINIKNMHFSSDPTIVLSSYLRFLQTEIENIAKIAEGIVYKLPKDEILSYLIITEEERE